MATFLLLTPERLAGVGRGAGLPFSFRVREASHWTVKPSDPEAVVAYPEQEALGMFERTGMRTEVRYGRWAGAADGLSWQDCVIAYKAARSGGSHGQRRTGAPGCD